MSVKNRLFILVYDQSATAKTLYDYDYTFIDS